MNPNAGSSGISSSGHQIHDVFLVVQVLDYSLGAGIREADAQENLQRGLGWLHELGPGHTSAVLQLEQAAELGKLLVEVAGRVNLLQHPPLRPGRGYGVRPLVQHLPQARPAVDHDIFHLIELHVVAELELLVVEDVSGPSLGVAVSVLLADPQPDDYELVHVPQEGVEHLVAFVLGHLVSLEAVGEGSLALGVGYVDVGATHQETRYGTHVAVHDRDVQSRATLRVLGVELVVVTLVQVVLDQPYEVVLLVVVVRPTGHYHVVKVETGLSVF